MSLYVSTCIYACLQTMIRKIFRSGNSVVVTLDKKMLSAVGLDGATYMVVEPDKNKKQIIIRKREKTDW